MSQASIEKTKELVSKTSKPVTIEDMVKKSIAGLKDALPSHMRAENIVRIALTTLKMNPALYECDPYSFLGALFQAAQLGLTPNVNGEAWIIPYNVKGRKVAQFQVGAYGLVKLYWNHQSAVSLQVEKVHEHDEFAYDLGTGDLNHKPPVFGKDRGDVIGYYAKANLANGGHAVKVLSKREAADFGKRFSKCWDRESNTFKQYTPWADHFDEMAKKTVLKQLMKLLPKSIEIQKALAFDETVKTKIAVDMAEVINEDDFKQEIAIETQKPKEISEEEKKAILEEEKKLK